MKKFVFAILAAALLLGVGAGVSYAYLTSQDKIVNQFQVSSVNVDIEEDFDPPEELEPGQVISKSPRIYSSSDTDCYVRVSVRFSDSEAEKFCEPLAIGTGWLLGEDGYYYWQKKLSPGERTDALFEQVVIRADADEEIPPFEILVYAEAVQCGDCELEEAWEEMI